MEIGEGWVQQDEFGRARYHEFRDVVCGLQETLVLSIHQSACSRDRCSMNG